LSIRVLEVVASLRRAGAEQVAVSLAGGLDRARFETAVVSLYDAFSGGFETALEECGVAVWHLGKRRGLDPRMWGRLAQVVRRFRPDVLHTHSYVMRYVLPAHFRRVVHTVHNLAEREVDVIGRVIHRLAFLAGAAPVAISDAVARSFVRLYGREPVAVIPNGVDVERGFRPQARALWRSRHGFGAGDCLVVSVARLEAQKNPLHLIRAFAEGLREAPAAHLLMAGEGALLEPARQLASQAEIAARVHFLGLCEDVAELLSACDLFALGSDWEGAPVAIVEAMAAHLPVVSTAVGGVSDLVEDEVTGILVPARDASALGRAMAALERDIERRQRMGAAAAYRAQRFGQAGMIDRYAELFERRARRAQP
jgi:glycosyltransferase involved in cell wall biosynthesis